VLSGELCGRRAGFGDVLIPLCEVGGLVHPLAWRGWQGVSPANPASLMYPCSERSLHSASLGLALARRHACLLEESLPLLTHARGASGRCPGQVAGRNRVPSLPRLREEQMRRRTRALADLRPKVSCFLLSLNFCFLKLFLTEFYF